MYSIIWNNRITGNPYLNKGFKVLCLNTFIPIIPPIDPPIKDTPNNVVSFILYLCLIAAVLSIKNNIKDNIFTTNKYIFNILIILINHLL